MLLRKNLIQVHLSNDIGTQTCLRIKNYKWYFVTKIVMAYCANCSTDREKLLKFKAEGQEFAKFLDH